VMGRPPGIAGPLLFGLTAIVLVGNYLPSTLLADSTTENSTLPTTQATTPVGSLASNPTTPTTAESRIAANISCSPGGRFFIRASRITIHAHEGEFAVTKVLEGRCGARDRDHLTASLVFAIDNPGPVKQVGWQDVEFTRRDKTGGGGSGPAWEIGDYGALNVDDTLTRATASVWGPSPSESHSSYTVQIQFQLEEELRSYNDRVVMEDLQIAPLVEDGLQPTDSGMCGCRDGIVRAV
jgi:hypothetical protein